MTKETTEMTAFVTLMGYDKAYAEGNPLVSDFEYDTLRSNMKKDYPDNEYWGKVGSKIEGAVEEKLPFTLGSLTKMKADGSMTEWLEKNPGNKITTAKLDGVSLYVSYVDGKYHQAFLRGDGEMGYDVTKKAKYCVAPKLVRPVSCELRGEAILIDDIHKELDYKTRRNGVAGLMSPVRKSNNNISKVTVMYYELLSTSEGLEDTERMRFAQMEEYGLLLAPMTITPTTATEEDFVKILREWKENYDFDMDGLVVCHNESERDDNFYPENKVAFKVNEEATLCEVLEVERSVGRTGKVTPVIRIAPTEIGGVTVEKATGFNYKFILDSGIDAGAVVGIYRSGDVIPYIDFVEKTVDPVIPMFCPACGSDLKWVGVDLRCEADDCKGKSVLAAEYFLRTLGVEEVTATTLRKIGAFTIEDCYDLDEFEISMLDGFGIKRAGVIVSEIQKSLKTTPDKFIAACGLHMSGLDTARTVLKVIDFDAYLAGDVTESDFLAIDGIGPVTADAFANGRERVCELYNFLVERGLGWSTATNTLKGKVFCLTGNGTVKRDVLVKMIEANGGYVKGMSKKVDVLVTKDPNSNSGKAKKARTYGTKIVGYDELMTMLET